MKNAKKIKGSLLGIAAAFALVCTQSAFTGAADRYYFYDDGTGAKWQTQAPTNKTCVTDNQRICSAEFDSAPTTTNNLIVNNPDAEETELGRLQ
ncbi:hypothetical protein [Pedobacter sp. SYP-B3415]|uniref:hypothetical protein n=1 Tax=Pedobacter sp. SYP-B3415 TaxID=2496641 RepID=UPI00101B68EF|nr:hypothetical protein [Pedobacter sp. SYP-B3415]